MLSLCDMQPEVRQRRDVTPEAGFLFGLLREIITMKTDRLGEQMNGILKGTLRGVGGDPVLQRVVSFQGCVLSHPIGGTEILGLASAFWKYFNPACRCSLRDGAL